jgi:hypothetical protein
VGTLLVYAVVAIVVAGALFLLATYFLPAGEQIAPVLRDEPLWALPDERSLSAAEVAQVRLPVALRGYRFAETDLLLDRLGEEIKARDAEIAQLRGNRPSPAPAAAPEAAETLESVDVGDDHVDS